MVRARTRKEETRETSVSAIADAKTLRSRFCPFYLASFHLREADLVPADSCSTRDEPLATKSVSRHLPTKALSLQPSLSRHHNLKRQIEARDKVSRFDHRTIRVRFYIWNFARSRDQRVSLPAGTRTKETEVVVARCLIVDSPIPIGFNNTITRTRSTRNANFWVRVFSRGASSARSIPVASDIVICRCNERQGRPRRDRKRPHCPETAGGRGGEGRVAEGRGRGQGEAERR